MTVNTQLLLTYLLSTPTLASDLRTLFDLALYETGDTPIMREEKDALRNASHLANLLDNSDLDELRPIL